MQAEPPGAFSDRSPVPWHMGHSWDLPVLAVGMSAAAQDLRLRRVRRLLANNGIDDVAFSQSGQDRHTEVVISELNGWPAFPLADPHLQGYPRRRTVRGQSDWLGLLCRTLSFPIPSRFIPALSPTPLFSQSLNPGVHEPHLGMESVLIVVQALPQTRLQLQTLRVRVAVDLERGARLDALPHADQPLRNAVPSRETPADPIPKEPR